MTTFTSPRIDPRTGFIQFQIPLLHLVGNDHRGPALSLMLHYCPLQTQRSLYGQGFNDTLSYFNPESRQLQTADGEHFGLNQQKGEWVFLPPSPLNIQLATREDSLWLYYRSGVVEIMARSPQQPADDPLWRLQTRLSAGGNALFLRWEWRQNLALLTSVADNDGELMHASLRLTPPEVKNSGMGGNTVTRCAVQTSVPSYRTSEAEIPNDADSNAQLSYTCFPASKAAVTTVLTLAGGKLVQLSCGPDGKRILCRIVYHPSLGVIQRVNLSGGVSESFSYAAGALSPLIQSHTTTVSNGDKILYSVTNTFSISRSGAESHEPAASHYPIGAAKAAIPYQSLISRTLDMSAENVLQPPGGGPEVQTIIHRFNCLHLLVAKEEIRETLVYGKRRRARISTQWTYDCDDARALADQPACYALPREKRITWDENGPAPRYLPHYRCEVSRYEYDIAGNLIRHVWPDGSSENIDYYSPAGEEHCPAEPQGFIRFIKKITYCQAGAPTPGRTLMYRYRGFPGRTDSPLAGRPMILCVAQEVPRQLLQRFDYHLAPDGAHNENGRLIKKTYTHYLAERPNTFIETYHWRKIIPAGCTAADALLQRETQLRHLDETTTLTTTRVWRHAGYALLSYIDAYGNITRYHYAPEGYLEKTQHHADTPDATISHRRVEDDFCQNRLITLTLTDIQGNRIISQVDGFGRLHRRDYQCQQHPLFSLPIEQRKYDSLGRLSRLITHDHADEEGAFRPLATRYHDIAWDQWGRHYASVDHDGEQGVCHYHHLDIIKQKSRRQSRSYRHRSQRANSMPHYSGILYERYRCGKPRRQLRLLPQPEDDKALIISKLRLEYDHQYRLNAVQERQIGQAIRWRYNEDDRVEQQTLQDGSLLHYGYPSPGDGPTSIDFSAASTAPLQKLYRYDTDHWGRRTAVREGGSPAAVSIGYPSLSPLPNHYQDADGDITQFCFHPTRHSLTRQSWEGGYRVCQYDNATGYLQECVEFRTDGTRPDAGKGTAVSRVALRYNPQGQRLQESIFGPQDKKLYEVNFHYSIAGRLLSVRDSEDAHLRYRYNAAGRLDYVRDKHMEIRFDYDHLDRLARRQVRLPGQENLSTQWLYDGFNRPVNLIITRQGGAQAPMELIISQQFNSLDQIVKRTLQHRRDGRTLRRNESYVYNARGCLTACRYAGDQPLLATVDGRFEHVIAERFAWDGLNNLTEATVSYAQPTLSGCPSEQTIRYDYDNPDYPTRRTRIQYGGADARCVELVYDPDGRLIFDGHRLHYKYDPLGRLHSVKADGHPETIYRYDAHNRLQGQSGEGPTSLRFYHGRRLAHMLFSGPGTPQERIDRVSYIHAAGLAAVKTRSAAALTVALTATDLLGSLLQYDSRPPFYYLAWGGRAVTAPVDEASITPLPAYLPQWQGEVYDASSGGYFLGNGYRLYRPSLQGFTTLDTLQTGGMTGINRYLYGRGDPINRYDPDGRLSWNAWANYAYGAGATLLAPAVFMAAGPAGFATALALSATELTSGLFAIGAGMLDRQHPHVAGVLSLCSLGIALAASGIGEVAAASEALAVEREGFASLPIYHLNASDMGLYTNYANRHILAFQTHGAPAGALLQDPGGQLVSAATIAREYIQPLLNIAMEIEQQVFSPNEPLLLLACYGSRSGAAREVANVLGRPVAAYDNVLYAVKAMFAEGWMGSDVMPRYQVTHNPLRRLWLHIRGQPMFQAASYQMVYPDGFDAMQQGIQSTISNFERHYYGPG